MTKHTPLPWKVKYTREIYGGESYGRFISTTESKNVMPHITAEDSANAEFIIRAVNSYEENQKTITILKRLLESERVAKHVSKRRCEHELC